MPETSVPAQSTAWSEAGPGKERAPRLAGTHVPALDGVRGTAVLLVMLFHFLGDIGGQSLAARAGVRLVQHGWVGVDLFFVLSGFLITGILLDSRDQPHYFRNFFARRVLRIFPLYYAFLALLFLSMPLLTPVIGEGGVTALREQQGWLWTYCVNVLVAIQGNWNDVPLVGHFWSLSVEEHFYLLWPLVVYRLAPATLGRVCIAILIGAPLLRIAIFAATGDGFAGNVLTPSRSDTLAAGGWLAIAARQQGGLTLIRRAAPYVGAAGLATLALLSALGAGAALQGIHFRVQVVGFTALAAVFVALLAMLLERPWAPAERVMTWKPLTVLGTYSYALYVFHQPIQRILASAGAGAEYFVTRMGDVAGGLLWFFFASGVTLAVSLVSWYVLERPALSLKRYFPR